MSDLSEDIAGQMGGQPEGWKQTTLADILTPEQAARLNQILKGNQDPDEALRAMKQYFATIRAELESKGVVPEYLAYLIYAHLIKAI